MASGKSQLANVAANAASVTIAEAFGGREGFFVFNDADKALYLKLNADAAASATSFTVKIAAGGFYEMPADSIYSGKILGIWEAAPTGAARITELYS